MYARGELSGLCTPQANSSTLAGEALEPEEVNVSEDRHSIKYA